MPNSAARLTRDGTGGASPSLISVLDLIKLVPRGGRGLDKSGPEVDGLLCCSGGPPANPSGILGRLPGPIDGVRVVDSGSDGLRFEDFRLVFWRGNVWALSSGRNGCCTMSTSVSGGPNPPYPSFLGSLGMPDFEPFEPLVEVRECPEEVDGRTTWLTNSAVVVGLATSFKLFCLRCPISVAPPSPSLRLLISKGPGAMVFILCNSPPLVAVLGLIGAYVGSPVAGFLADPLYLSSRWTLDDVGAGFVEGKGGKAQSRFDDNNSGDRGRLMGAVALRAGRLNG